MCERHLSPLNYSRAVSQTARDWLGDLIDRVQSFPDLLSEAEPTETSALADRWVKSLPAAADPIEQLALALLLVNVAVVVLDHLHRDRGSRDCKCYDAIAKLIRTTLPAGKMDSRAIFSGWLGPMQRTFLSEHPPTISEQAALLVRKEPARRWKLSETAATFGTPARRFAIEFQHVFARPFRDYVHLVRLSRALPEITEDGNKVEAAALNVGFKSKKDLYRACAKALRTTPAKLRRLETSDRTKLYGSLSKQQFPSRTAPPPALKAR